MVFNFRKAYFYRLLLISILISILAFSVCFKFNHYLYSRIGVPVFIIVNLIPINYFVYLATKTPLQIDEDRFSFRSTVNGNYELVDFSQVRIIKYLGHEKLFSDDQLILGLLDGRTIRIFCGYERHFELWERIIIGAMNYSICLDITPSVIKKMDGHWTDSECAKKAKEMANRYRKSFKSHNGTDTFSAKRVLKLFLVVIGIIIALVVVLGLISFFLYLFTGKV